MLALLVAIGQHVQDAGNRKPENIMVSNSIVPNSNVFHLALIRDSLGSDFNSAKTPLYPLDKNSFSVVWLQNGHLEINARTLKEGTGKYLEPTDIILNQEAQHATLLRFTVSKNRLPAPSPDTTATGTTAASTHKIILEQSVKLTAQKMILRLDQVDFPPATVAYKHTHPGPGIRYLVKGGLTLASDHGTQSIKAGDAWFEGANSPVEATAIDTTQTRFVRTMLLPSSYLGHSSFTLCDKADASKPRLQANIRHFEKLVALGALA